MGGGGKQPVLLPTISCCPRCHPHSSGPSQPIAPQLPPWPDSSVGSFHLIARPQHFPCSAMDMRRKRTEQCGVAKPLRPGLSRASRSTCSSTVPLPGKRARLTRPPPSPTTTTTTTTTTAQAATSSRRHVPRCHPLALLAAPCRSLQHGGPRLPVLRLDEDGLCAAGPVLVRPPAQDCMSPSPNLPVGWLSAPTGCCLSPSKSSSISLASKSLSRRWCHSLESRQTACCCTGNPPTSEHQWLNMSYASTALIVGQRLNV